MVSELAVWGILLLPLASFAIIAIIIRPFLNQYSLVSGLLLIGSLAVALLLSIDVLSSVIQGTELEFELRTWIDLGSDSYTHLTLPTILLV